MTEDNVRKINWKKVFKLALILFIITAVAALCLAFTNTITKDIIAEQKLQANNEAKKYVLEQADTFRPVENVAEIARKADPDNAALVAAIDEGLDQNGQSVGYVIKTLPSGYGGEIELLTGIGNDGMINGITILSIKETAGLGARATEDSFLLQYLEKDTAMDIALIKNGEAAEQEVNAIAGATITSTAVTLGVNLASDVFQALKGGI